MSTLRSSRRAPSRALLLLLLGASACYDYVPVTRTAPGASRAEVELALTDSGAVVLAREVGPASTAIDGALVTDSAGSYVIAVRQVRRRGDDPAPWRGEHIVVPHALVASVSERRLSRPRTALTVAATVAGVVLARLAIAHGGGSNAGGGGTGSGGTK